MSEFKFQELPIGLHLEQKALTLRCLSSHLVKNGRLACGRCDEEKFCRKIWEKVIGG